MSNGAVAAAAAVERIQALKASGAIVSIGPEEFVSLIGKTREPLIVQSVGGVFSNTHHYLAAYKGLIFFTKSKTPLLLPGKAEVVHARSIWIPG